MELQKGVVIILHTSMCAVVPPISQQVVSACGTATILFYTTTIAFPLPIHFSQNNEESQKGERIYTAVYNL